MNPFVKRSVCLFCAAAAALMLGGCGKEKTPEPTQTLSTEIITLPTAPIVEETTAPTDPREEITDLSVSMVAGELYTLESYPNLKSVDFTNSTCYSAIRDYMAQHPQVSVTYNVDFGGTVVPHTAQSATLNSGAFQFDSLLENLQYLPDLTILSLPGISLTPEQVSSLAAAYPNVILDFTVEIAGTEYGAGTTELDLSDLSADQLKDAAKKIGLLTALTDVHLSSSLPMEDVESIQRACPSPTYHYEFKLFGKTISTADAEVVYKGHSIGNDGEAELRQALQIMDHCERFVLDNCGLDYEVLAAIREDFRDGPNVVWRVYFGKDSRYNALTDDETIRAVYNVMDENVGPLVYCEGAKYIDMGHNETLTDLSFVRGMPNLEVFIASGCAVKELVGFENCKKLTWLELASCHKLENIDSLAGCESLAYLNISYTKVSSFLALDSLPLVRFVCLNPKASTEEQNTFIAIHDGCRTAFYGYNNPWTPWRYDDNGKTFNAYYKDVVRKAFNYDYLETLLPKE